MNGLLIDTPDSGRVTKEQAFAIALPEKTRTYQPVSNEALMDMLGNVANERGLQLGTPELGVSNKGQRLFGSVPITNQVHLDEEVELMLGFRNSYDRTMSVGICFGSRVFVCSNMCFTGYTSEGEEAVGVVHKRHCPDVWDGLHQKIQEAMSKFEVFKSYQTDFYNRLKNIRLRDVQAHDLIIQSVRAGAITAKDCMAVANEWAFQSNGATNEAEQERWHKEFAPRNAWSLFNAYTEVHKAFQSKNSLEASNRSIKMNGFFHQKFVN